MILATTTHLDINTVIVSCIAVLYALSLGLIKYVVSQKDKQTDIIGSDIKEIKEMMAFIQANNATVRSELENIKKTGESTSNKVEEVNKKMHEIQLDLVQLKEWRIGADRKFEDIYKKLEELTKNMK